MSESRTTQGFNSSFSSIQLDRLRRQVMSTEEAAALADAVAELVLAAHDVLNYENQPSRLALARLRKAVTEND